MRGLYQNRYADPLPLKPTAPASVEDSGLGGMGFRGLGFTCEK